MGSSSSKIAKTAGSSARRYPAASSMPRSANSPQSSSSQSQVGPIVHPQPPAATSKDQHIELDARDPDFGSRLSQIGPVKPAPTASHSSTFAPQPHVVRSSSTSNSTSSKQSVEHIFPSPSSNPALVVIQARERLARLSEEETENMGRRSFKGRTLISASDIKTLLSSRDDAKNQPGEIEKQLRLRQGLVAKLGPSGVVQNA